MKNKNSIWSLFKIFVNSHPVGCEFTRKELIEYFESVLDRVDTRTIDTYRNGLTSSSHLSIVSRGKYIVNKHIDDTLTVNVLRESYDK